MTTEREIPAVTVRGTRKAPEIVAWVLWIVAFLIVMVLGTMSMDASQLTLDQRYVAAIQFALIGWIVFIPSAYFWRRGDGRSHLDGIIWSTATLAIPGALMCFVATPAFWGAALAPIPLSAIF